MIRRNVAKQLKALTGPKGRLAKLRAFDSQSAFARRLGFSQQNINQWENGVTPSLASLIILAEKRQVNLNWLLLGKGPMYRSNR